MSAVPPRTEPLADRAAQGRAGAEPGSPATGHPTAGRPMWQRVLWGVAGAASLVTGIVGAFLPVLPTVPFVLLAAFCFARSSTRCEAWILAHPRFGPMVRNWRDHHAIPRKVKRLAWTMMAISSAIAAVLLPVRIGWIPAACCAAVAFWMWRLPEA